MASFSRPHALASLTLALCGISLVSCALPPKAAWRKIKSDGLISYFSYELANPRRSARPITPPVTPYQTRPIEPTQTQYLPSTSLVENKRPVEPVKPPLNLADLPEKRETLPVLTAFSVPALPGYVRSPYTQPPRLVDVQGSAAGSTMVCPYTQRPFTIPNDVNEVSESLPQVAAVKETPSMAEASVFIPAPKTSSSQEDKDSTSGATSSVQTTSTLTNNSPVAVTETPVQITPSSPAHISTPPAPAKEVPTQSAVIPNQAALQRQPAANVPFGIPIPHRPGFINSPYAAKHQVVDVTDMPAGSEVKCPYTGKTFRVPVQDTRTLPAETPNFASPKP